MQNNKRKIYLLLDSSKMGGIESHVVQLAKGLKNNNLRVEVILFHDHGPHPLHAILAAANIGYSINRGGWRSLYRKFKNNQPALVHTHGYRAGVWGRITARLAGIKVISTYHAGELGKGRIALYDAIDRWTGFLSHKRITVSEQIAQRLPYKSYFLNNFVELPEQLSSGNQIAFVGRLSHEKGPDIFVELASCFPDTQFHLYGDGDMVQRLKTNAPANVIFEGNQSAMEQVWPRIGLLVMTSRHEGLPMAALEAMAHGIPVISSRVGALPRLIEHGVNGYLCDVKQLDEFRKYIQVWLNDATHRSELAKAARLRLENEYSTDSEIVKVLNLYRQVSPNLAISLPNSSNI